MPRTTRMIRLANSERTPLANALAVGRTPDDERMEITVRVRRRAEIAPHLLARDDSARPAKPLSRKMFALRHGALPQDLARVAAFAKKSGLQVLAASAARRTVTLHGTAGAFSSAFGVKLERYEHDRGTYRGRTGAVKIPHALKGIIVGVFGLDNRPYARPRSRRFRDAQMGDQGIAPVEVAKRYHFPPGLDGRGQCIGVIELAGGYRPEDLKQYFQRLGVPEPRVSSVSVDHGQNRPTGNPDSADGEVMLDLEVIGAVAPGAHIVTYFTPDTSDRSFIDALTHAVHDDVNRPSVISISWGAPESVGTGAFMKQFDEALQSAAAMGITVCVAAGDEGAADERPSQWDGRANADFPASSPYTLACGGTRLANGSGVDSVWNQGATDQRNDSFGATGGGISEVFGVPAYQTGLKLPPSQNAGAGKGRGVPDVAGNADPATGYTVQVDGAIGPIGGTSAVAPLWAGLIARLNQSLGKPVGFFNPWLYAHRNDGIFQDVTHGSNKVSSPAVGYAAAPGWDACTGLGTPDGEKLLAKLASANGAPAKKPKKR
jgi:kumamolisin